MAQILGWKISDSRHSQKQWSVVIPARFHPKLASSWQDLIIVESACPTGGTPVQGRDFHNSLLGFANGRSKIAVFGGWRDTCSD